MISTQKPKMYTIDGSKYWAKNECNTIILAPRRRNHPSSGANTPSDVGVTVNINAEFNLMAVNPIIECFSRDLVTKYCHSLESRLVNTAPPIFVKTLPGRSNRSLPRLPLHMHAQIIIPTFEMSNIYIGLCLPKAHTLTRLRSYEKFKLLLIVRINKTVGRWGIVNFRLLRDAFPYRLAGGIPLKEGVP